MIFFFLRQLPICVGAHTVSGIVIKPGLEVDPAKKSGPEFYGSNWVNPGKSGKIEKN